MRATTQQVESSTQLDELHGHTLETEWVQDLMVVGCPDLDIEYLILPNGCIVAGAEYEQGVKQHG